MLERRIAENGVVYYVSPLLAVAGVAHAFSTRIGGVSGPPFDSLNLGNPAGCPVQDAAEHLPANYQRLQAAIGCAPNERCWVHQVHGDRVAVVRTGESFASGGEADALVCDDPQRLVAVRTADCVPILLATEDGRAVAAVHAGWRGVVGGVAAAAVAAMRRLWPQSVGANGRTHLLAAIGPCIGPEAFEVGPDVLEQFRRAFGPDAPVRETCAGKGFVDMPRAVRMQLRDCGVEAGCIDSTDRCTYRDGEEFFSHRRDKGITGRMAAIIAPRA